MSFFLNFNPKTGCRWSTTNDGLLEFFYDGTKIREINDPLLVSRAATFFILSAEVFTDPGIVLMVLLSSFTNVVQ